jgi:hypothetical protein
VFAVVGLKARDLIGFSFLQFAVHLPMVLFLLWLLGLSLTRDACTAITRSQAKFCRK